MRSQQLTKINLFGNKSHNCNQNNQQIQLAIIGNIINIMDQKVKPTLGNQNNFKIRLLSLKKIDNREIKLSDNKINLIWFYKNRSELKNLDKKIKSELRDKINLIKCQKIQSFTSLNIVNKSQMCLVLLNIQYQKSLLKCFQDYNITYMIYNEHIQNMIDDFKSSKVYFMTQKEQILYQYIKDYLNRVSKTPIAREDIQKKRQEELNIDINKHLEIKLEQKSVELKHLPKITKTPMRQTFTKQHFLNSNYLNPGPGQYQISKSNGKYTRKTNDRQVSPKITETKFHQVQVNPFKIKLQI